MSDHIWNAIDVLTDEDRALGAVQWAELRGPHHLNGRHLRIEESMPWLGAYLETCKREGLSVGDIANELCQKYGTVCRWFRKLGITPRWDSRGNSRVWCDIKNRFVPVAGTMGTRLGIRARRDQPRTVLGDAARMAKMREAAVAAKKRNRAAVCIRGHKVAYGIPCRPCAAMHARDYRARRKAAAA